MYTQGISKISNLDINYARENNMTIKLLGSTVNNNGEITSSITPVIKQNKVDTNPQQQYIKFYRHGE